MSLNKSYLILFSLVFVPMLQSFLYKFNFSKNIPLINNIDEIFLLFLIIPAILGFQNILRNKYWSWVLIFFSSYLILASISSVFYGITIFQFVSQLFISLKFPYVLCVFLGIRNGKEFLNGYIRLAKFVLTASIILMLWQFLLPQFYSLIFSAGLHKGTALISEGVYISRGAGIYAHPGQMGIFAGSFTIILFYKQLKTKGLLYNKNAAWLAMSFMALILTFSRLEAAATIIGLLAAYLFVFKGQNRLFRFAIWFCLVSVLTFAIYPSIMFIYANSVGDGFVFSSDPRIVFFVKGVEIANDYFPLGSGMGTFGGYVAAIYDSPLYIHYGFQEYYWYRQGNFLADTFWPHILGESGYLGLFCYTMSLLVIVRIAIKQAKRTSVHRAIPMTVISTMFLIGLNSMASPDLVSTLSLSQCLIPIACMRIKRELYA